MKTRKEIGDRDGWKSFYAVEIYLCNMWCVYHYEYVSRSKSKAVTLRDRAYSEYNNDDCCNLPQWCFRVALYTRAE